MKKLFPIRQGELMLVPVVSVPNGRIAKSKSQILAHSESGHHHVLEATKPFEVITDTENDNIFVRLMTEGVLTHLKETDRHEDLQVAPNTYRVVHKKAYDPWQKVMRRVQD